MFVKAKIAPDGLTPAFEPTFTETVLKHSDPYFNPRNQQIIATVNHGQWPEKSPGLPLKPLRRNVSNGN
jgi:hypothetical protein